MNILLTISYLSLFLTSILNKKAMALFMPLFLFVYPKNLTSLSVGDINLSMIFILISSFQLIPRYNTIETSCKKLIRLILIFFICIPLGSQVFSLFFIDYFELLNCFKSIIDIVLCTMGTVCILLNICHPKYQRITIIGLIFAFLIECIVASGLLVNFDYYKVFYNWKELDNSWVYNRASGSFSGPWALGGFSTVSILLLINLLGIDNDLKINRLVVVVASLATAYTLIITLSRASWLFLIVSLTILLVNGNKATMKALLWFLAFGFFVSIFIVDREALADIVSSRIVYSFENSQTGNIDPSTLERFSIWKIIFKNYDPLYLITGYGIRHANDVFGHTPHNTFLSLFVYSGISGYILVYILFSKIVKIAKLVNPQSKIIINSLLIGAGAYGVSADIMYDTRVMAIIFIAIISFLTIKDKNLKIKKSCNL